MENKLSLVAQENNLKEDKVQTLMSSFGDAYQKARGLVKGAKLIIVASEDQIEIMQQARELRLDLKGVRVSVEKTRKELKEQSLREGRAIDGMANIIKALIVPVEEHLEAQEKFAERIQAQKECDVEFERVSKLGKYVEDVGIYSLHPKGMSDETFTKLLETSRIAFEIQRDAKKKAEEERVVQEKAEEKEQERIRKENEKLKTEAEEGERKQAKERKKQQAKLDAEREKREAIEDKIREEGEAEEARLKAEADAKQKALLAPDKEKLMEYANTITLNDQPMLKSKEAREIVENTQDELERLANIIREKTKSL